MCSRSPRCRWRPGYRAARATRATWPPPAMLVQGRPVRRPPRVVARDDHLGIRAQQPHVDDLHTHLHGGGRLRHAVVVAPLQAD